MLIELAHNSWVYGIRCKELKVARTGYAAGPADVAEADGIAARAVLEEMGVRLDAHPPQTPRRARTVISCGPFVVIRATVQCTAVSAPP
jgi:hypothetical protein